MGRLNARTMSVFNKTQIDFYLGFVLNDLAGSKN